MKSQYSKVNQQLDQVNNKLDRLLSAPERKFQLHLREANLYHKFKKKQESADELKAANDAAKDAFNTADNIEGWVKATDFRMTCAFMKLSFDISPRKDTELQILGETLKLHLDDLREKIEDRKIRDQEEANSASFGSGKAKKKEAEENREHRKIKDQELKALDVSFHPTCFNCSQCGDNLSGDDIRFMADDAKEIFCLDCYNKNVEQNLVLAERSVTQKMANSSVHAALTNVKRGKLSQRNQNAKTLGHRRGVKLGRLQCSSSEGLGGETVTDVLQTWLSFLPIEPNSVQKIIGTLQGEYSNIDKKLDQANQKLDRILNGPAKKCALLIKEALISLQFQKRREGEEQLNLAAEAAKDAFTLSDEVRGWVESSSLRIACALLKIQHEDFALMSSLDKQRLAATYKLQVNDLQEKIVTRKAEDTKEAENANPLIKNNKRKATMHKFEEYDLLEGKVLKSAYGMMSEGFGWTNPRQRIPITQDHLSFEVMPQYIPIDEINAVYILVKQEPEILVSVHRKVEYNCAWLSLLPIKPGSVQKIIETLQGEISTISKQLDKANNKLDRLLEIPNLECIQHLKAAIVSFRNKKEEDGQASLTAALTAATRGFSLAKDVNGWIHRGDEEFALISLESKKWLAEMYELHISSLRQKMHQKRGSLKADIKKSAFFMQGGKSKDVIRKLNEFDLQESKALHSVYGVMSEGCGWTNPKGDIPNSQGHIMFDVMPQYIPIGAKNAVCLLVLQEPEICVKVYRKHEYLYDKTKKTLVTGVTLFWSIDNGPQKVKPLDLEELSDCFRISICVDELDK
eukprot:TCALIF_11493-PA protein Name:"Protein of unknown function" AED:0.95 eAED:0.96 QI:0/0/0/0.22/1/1/9/0/800